jgi:hypothetical protein
MGGQFHRLVMAAMAAGLLVIPGCGAAPDGTGQAGSQEKGSIAEAQTKIVSAQLDGATSLRVTFSDGVKAVTGVDPAKFRLTVAYYTRPGTASGKYSYGYYAANKGYTVKSAKGYAVKGYGAGAKGYYGSKYAYGVPEHTIYSEVAPVSSLANDKADATQAVLQLDGTFSAATACQEIKAFNAANPNAQAGLYLHYSEAGTPTIEDTNGKPVESLAAYWSVDPTVEQAAGDFTGKPIPVALTCP